MQIAVIYSLGMERSWQGSEQDTWAQRRGRPNWHVRQQGSKLSTKSHFDHFTCCGRRVSSKLEVPFHQQPSCSRPGCGAAVLPRQELDRRGGIIPTLMPVILSALTFRVSSASALQPACTSRWLQATVVSLPDLMQTRYKQTAHLSSITVCC